MTPSSPPTLSYISTRGGATSARAGFLDVLMQGPAPDGGLYVPGLWLKGPALDPSRPYAEAAALILKTFAGADLADEDCVTICRDAYAGFDSPDVAPLRQLDDRLFLLELFHGPTLAFKDVALQVLARLFDCAMAGKGEKLTLIGATSGDTGSAAIEACRSCRNVEIFILYPDGRPSDIQRLQMTTVKADNVHSLAIEGDFDSCQAIVKALFADPELTKVKRLSAVNSINWARIAMQSVYYALAALRLPGARFVVPSGNFGNLYAGFAARTLGYPVGQLIAATNRNDALHRFFTEGRLEARPAVATLSPSMDIQIPSNLERYIFELLGRDPALVREAVAQSASGWTLDPGGVRAARAIFASGSADDAATMDAMADFAVRYKTLIDPHTAVGAAVAARLPKSDAPTVLLATAHAAKFPDAVLAATGRLPPRLPAIEALFQKRETIYRLPPDLAAIRHHILSFR